MAIGRGSTFAEAIGKEVKLAAATAAAARGRNRCARRQERGEKESHDSRNIICELCDLYLAGFAAPRWSRALCCVCDWSRVTAAWDLGGGFASRQVGQARAATPRAHHGRLM